MNEQSRHIAAQGAAPGGGDGGEIATYSPDDLWRALAPVELGLAHLARNRIVSARKRDPAHMAIDMLRTRMLQALKEHRWSRVAITAPQSGCGSSFVAANLAISMARGESRRVVLMDMNLRRPALARLFGIADAPRARDYLSGCLLAEEYFRRVGANLALGLNAEAEPNAAEFLLEPMTAEILDEMQALLAPEVVLYDLPPALEHDDLVAFLPRVDGVLLVAGSGLSSPETIRASERLIGDTPLIGVVLNRGEDG